MLYVIGQGVGLIVTGLILRLSISFIVVLGNGFNWLEMCFVSVAWLPKATVQVCAGVSTVIPLILIINIV